MAEWLYEAGIGEARAALVAGGRIVEARIEREGSLRVGAVVAGRLTDLLPGRQGIVSLGGDGDALLASMPAGVTQGQALLVTVVREAIPEPGRAKHARVAVAPEGSVPAPGPDLLARIVDTGVPVRECRAHEPDHLEAAGWSDLLDEATSGEIAFAGGTLRLSPTPAMTLFDVDGPPPAEALSLAAARAVAEAIVRMDIGGSIGVDFPTIAGRAPRQAVADTIDRHLPLPFERTAVNGFGFLQIVRPRPRVSLPERLRADPVAAAALAALRMVERTPPGTWGGHRLPAAVIARIERHPLWLAELARRTGVIPVLEPA